MNWYLADDVINSRFNWAEAYMAGYNAGVKAAGGHGKNLSAMSPSRQMEHIRVNCESDPFATVVYYVRQLLLILPDENERRSQQ